MDSIHARLEIRGVRKSFSVGLVLDGLNLSISEGETLVLMGASGSGKSVLAKCVLGLIPVDAGNIFLDGAGITHLRETEREKILLDFGVLFQRGALFDSLPVWENVAFGLIVGRGMAIADAKTKAIDTLAQLGLDAQTAMLSPHELSGGMKKRVALARAIVASPKFLVLDEPTEGLDPIMTDVVSDLVAATAQGLGATTLAISNNIACAQKIATRIAVLKDGKIFWQGTAQDISRCEDPYVLQFVRKRLPVRT